MDERQEWEAERRAVIQRQRIEREEAAERRESEARQVERQARTEAAMHARQLTGQPIPSVSDVLARARSLSEADGPGRDAGAGYGSAARPAMYATAADGSPVEMTARPAGVQRSVSQAADDELLRRALASSVDSYMRVHIARLESRRRHEVSRDAEPAVGRSQASGMGWPEISR
jgi:hypothetical protein